MEEIENRLYCNNPISISSLISKIVGSVQKKHENGIKDFPEVKFLKEKLISADPLVSEISGTALKCLINNGVLSVENVLTDLLSMMNSAKCYPVLVNLLGDLLCLQFKNKNINIYNLSNPRHPFITLVIENADVSHYALNKLKNLQGELTESDVLKIFQPFYLYSLCCPLKTQLYLLKKSLWNFLLNANSIDTVSINFYVNVLCWLQIQKREDLQVISDQINDAVTVSLKHTNFLNFELLVLWQINVLHNLSRHKLDLQLTLTCLRESIVDKKLILINSILIILSQVIDNCSPTYLQSVLNLCKDLILGNSASPYSLQTIKASILPWLASPCILTNDAYGSAKDLLTVISDETDETEKNMSLQNFVNGYMDQICTEKYMFLSINISLQFDRVEEEEELKKWINSVKETPQEFKLDIFNVLCGMLMIDYKNSDISIDILEILVKCVESDIYLSAKLLTLIFFKISNNQQPKFNINLLKSLPRMAILRENIPKIIATIQAISKGSENLYNVGLSLACEIWRLDNKCYSYLEDLLVQNPPTKKRSERYIIKAYILKQLCDKRPELYGKDIIAHLSKILNECSDDNCALPCSLAIEAITILCKAGIIDINTTWATLLPKFKDDLRYPVIKSLCALIQEIPQLSNNTELYKDLFTDVTKILWKYVDYGDSKISEVALNSLSYFGMEHLCQNMPEKYLETGTTPNMNSITGKTWIHFLIENSASPAALHFIQKMISKEIDEYLKYVYQSKGPKEPINYSYLPSYSVVRGLGEFIKTWANKWRGSIHDKLYLECLKIFSVEYSKPLPPLDWCFLQELIHDPKTKEYSLNIASHQVVLSGTARRLVENYIAAVTQSPKDEDIRNVFKNLKFLARSIQPVILKPFFETTIWYAIKKYNEGERDLLNYISEFLKIVLALPEVQETNKLTIIQVLDSIIFVTDIGSQLFEVLCQTIIVSPSECIKQATSFKVDDNEENFRKASKIRCARAMNSKIKALIWLDEIIEAWSTNFREINLWKDFSMVFQKHNNNTDESIPWFLDLIGLIQAKIADRCDTPVVCFLFDILILAVVFFSGHCVFLNKSDYERGEFQRIFPPSLASLMDRMAWEICSIQVLEWLYHINTEESIPKTYRRIFGICLQALKHNEEFVKNERWLKYLNSCTNFE